MATKRKDAVETAEREVERWRGEVQRLEAEAEQAKVELLQIEEEWRSSALAGRVEGGQATARVADLRATVAERRLLTEESIAAADAARTRLAASEQSLEVSRRAAVQELARVTSAQLEAHRREAIASIEKLGAALDALSAAAMRAAGYEATLNAGTYSLEQALAGRAGSPSVIYGRLMHANTIAEAVRTACGLLPL